jgi:hypothetical protein
MEQSGKIDIKSELIRAGTPYARAGIKRFLELSKMELLKVYLAVYFAIGFILQGVVGNLPDMLLGFFGWSGTWVHVMIFMFWPVIMWSFISEEHTFFTFMLMLAGTIYIVHIRDKLTVAEAALVTLDQKANAVPAQPNLQSPAPIVAQAPLAPASNGGGVHGTSRQSQGGSGGESFDPV